jgi:hypothetical protein
VRIKNSLIMTLVLVFVLASCVFQFSSSYRKTQERRARTTQLGEIGRIAYIFAKEHNGYYAKTMNELWNYYIISSETLTEQGSIRNNQDSTNWFEIIWFADRMISDPSSTILAISESSYNSNCFAVLYVDGRVLWHGDGAH